MDEDILIKLACLGMSKPLLQNNGIYYKDPIGL